MYNTVRDRVRDIDRGKVTDIGLGLEIGIEDLNLTY